MSPLTPAPRRLTPLLPAAPQLAPDMGEQGGAVQAMFSVFDGHGGRQAADFAAEHLHGHILEAMAACAGGGDASIAEGIKNGYLRTDEVFVQRRVASGAAAVTAIIRDGTLWVGHAGDCRAVLSCAGRAEALTADHKPNCEAERSRIAAQVRQLPCSSLPCPSFTTLQLLTSRCRCMRALLHKPC